MHNTVLNIAFLDHELGLAELQPLNTYAIR
ncbi:hypothetical protein C8R32_10165 [Nitrosospira sp. Nsp5]|uniref:Uncharacterized protein n=1 Tax=Nitrosospira multiformis TaxID=1231 RepID=A0ABY0TGY0_9PROT|nr:hypothetical protein C8R32_10165 [Nitrosospira sp. Nsp5]SDQ81399.1 hypothetical protein SAMN05216402_2397 [Nitrosospira multiformis]